MKSVIKSIVSVALVVALGCGLFATMTSAITTPDFSWYADDTNKGTTVPSGYFGYGDFAYGYNHLGATASLPALYVSGGYSSAASVSFRDNDSSVFATDFQHTVNDCNLTVYLQGHNYVSTSTAGAILTSGALTIDGTTTYIVGTSASGVPSFTSTASASATYKSAVVVEGGTLTLKEVNLASAYGHGLEVNGGTVADISGGTFSAENGYGLYIGAEGNVASVSGGTFIGYLNNNTSLKGFISGGVFDFTNVSSVYSDFESDIKSGYIARLDSKNGNGKFTVVKNNGITSGTYMEPPVCASGYDYITETFNDITVYTVSKDIIRAKSLSFGAATLIADISQGTYSPALITTPSDANESITWVSSDTTVATVNNGKIIPKHWGKTTITASTAKNVSASVELIVTDKTNGYYYITDTGMSNPVKSGNVFAGWYNLESGRDVTSSDWANHTGAASCYPTVNTGLTANVFTYAKFVPEEVTTVKAQTDGNLAESSASTDIRFISTVDSLAYSKIGFDITVNGKTVTAESKNVYSQLVGGKYTYTPDKISSISKYFFTYTLKNIPNSDFGTDITVKPYAITLTGLKVYGKTVTKNVKDSLSKTIVLNTMPDKYIYYQNSNLDLTGCTVKLERSGEIINVTSSMVSGYSASKLGKQTITVTYNGEKAYFDVNVITDTSTVFKTANAFNSHMVLQRDANTPVFGFGDNGDIITVKFNGQTVIAEVANNMWTATFSPMSANAKSQNLVIKSMASGTTVTYTDILVGDVWYTSGQSNMFMRIGDIYPLTDHGDLPDSYRSYDEYYKYYSTYCKNDMVRACFQEPGVLTYICGAYSRSSAVPLDDMQDRMNWTVCNVTAEQAATTLSSNYAAVDNLSAYAVSFALQLQPKMDVPIGVVTCSQGGTSIAEWLPLNNGGIDNVPNRTGDSECYGNYYNSLVYPLRNFAFRGMVWYQGESDAIMEGYNTGFSAIDYDSNRNRVDRYGIQLTRLYNTLSSQFTLCNDNTFYFLETDICRCPLYTVADAWNYLRSQQQNYLANIPNSILVPNPDELGRDNLLHPIWKYTLGGYAADKAYTLMNK